MKGHVRRRGSSWELRAYVGVDPTTNRTEYLTRTFRGGKREADEALARFVTEVSSGGHAAKDTTLKDSVRLHDLRHFTATRLLSEGVPVRTVSGRLGRANAATTLGVYAHFVEESDRDAADKIASILTRDSEGRSGT